MAKDKEDLREPAEIVNKVTLVDSAGNPQKNESGEDIVIDQKIAVDPKANHYIEFKDTFTNKDGKKEDRSLFHVDKDESGNYTIEFGDLSVFKTKDGKSFADILGTNKINLEPGKSEIVISKDHGATCFQIQAFDGKTYYISTNANSISIKDENGEEFVHKTEKGIGIDQTLHTTAIEDFFDKNNKMCKTKGNAKNSKAEISPKRLNDFPIKNLSMYFATLRGNTVKDLGDYKVTTIDPIHHVNDKKASETLPYAFMSKTDPANPSKVDSYFLIYGKMERVEKIHLQYEEVNGKLKLKLGIQVVPQTKNSVNRRVYPIDLPTNDKGELTPEALEALDNILKISDYSPKTDASDKKVGKYTFSKDDNRGYAEYRYKLTPDTYSLVDPDLSDDEENSNYDDGDGDDDGNNDNPGPDAPVPPDNNRNPSNEIPGDGAEKPGDGDVNKNPDTNNPQNPDKSDEINNASAEPKEKIVSTKEHDFSGHAEAYGLVAGYIGAFIFLGALISGLGILAFIGIGIFCAGTMTAGLKSLFVFKPFNYALKRVQELEQQEDEDEQFAENFLANEKELNKATEISAEKENQLSDYVNNFYTDFADAYEEFGIGFSNGLVAGHKGSPENGYPRLEKLMSQQGLDIKKSMLISLQNIQSSINEKERNENITKFVDSHFSLPNDKKETLVQKMFGGNTEEEKSLNREQLVSFIKHLDEAVTYETKSDTLLKQQEAALGTARDSKLAKLLNHKDLNADSRKKILNRYSSTLVRRLSTDKNISESKLDKLIGNLPAEEKLDAFNTLINAHNEITSSIEHIESVAKENRELIANSQTAGEYVKTFKNLSTGATQLSSYKEASQAIKNLILEKTNHYHNARTLKDYQKKIDSSTELGKNLGLIADIYKIDPASNKVATCQKDLMRIVLNEFDDILESPIEQNMPAIIPDFEEILKTGKVGTVENLAQKLVNETDQLGNKTERAEKLQKAIANLNEAKKEVRSNTSKNLDSIFSSNSEVMKQFEVIGNNLYFLNSKATTTEQDKDKNVFNNLVVKAKADKLKESIFVRNFIKSEETIRNIAKCMLIAEKASTTPIYNESTKKEYKNALSILNAIVKGNLAEANINSSIETILDTSKPHTSKELKNAAKNASEKIKGYQKAIKIIDKMGISAIAEQNQKSDRQQFIDEFKAIDTSQNPNGAFARILRSKVGDLKLDKAGNITIDKVSLSSVISREDIVKKIEEISYLTEDQKKIVIDNLPETITDETSNKDITDAFSHVKNPNMNTRKSIKDDVKRLTSYFKSHYDLEKATEIINNAINTANHIANVETHCHDASLGEEFATSELNRTKNKHKKAIKTESKYENIYDMLENLLASKVEDPEQAIGDAIRKNPKISAWKIAKSYGIKFADYLKAHKDISKNGVDESVQKDVWLKEKEVDKYLSITGDIKLAWENALKGNTNALKQFIDNAKSLIKLNKEKKAEKESPVKLSRKMAKNRKENSEIYADVIARAGLNLDDLDNLVHKGDETAIIKRIEELEKRDPIKKLEGLETDKQNELAELKIKKDLLTESDRAIFEAETKQCHYNMDVNNYQAKLEVIESLSEKGVPDKIINDAYVAFAKGDLEFFNKTKVSTQSEDDKVESKSINDLLMENSEFMFDITDTALLMRLGINPEDIMDPKKRLKKLETIRQNIEQMQENNKKDVENAQNKVVKESKTQTDDLSKKERREAGDGLRKLFKLFSRKQEKAQKEVDKIKEEKAQREVEEQAYERTDENNNQKPDKEQQDSHELE